MTSTRYEDGADGRLIHLEGELDHEGVEEIVDAFNEAVGGAADRVTVDMGGVSFVSSQGIWLMLQTHKQLAGEGRVMHVRNFRPHVHRVFDTVGVFKAVPEWRED